MEGRACGPVSLIGPSGNVWHVDLTQGNDDLFFAKGWPAFVRDHFIECGDLLVFRYDGELHFTVQVFDQSACEKEASFNLQSSQNSRKFDDSRGQKRDREEVAVPSDKVFQGVLRKLREVSSEFQSECIDKNQEAGSCEEKKWCVSLLNSFALPSQSKAYNVKPGNRVNLASFGLQTICFLVEQAISMLLKSSVSFSTSAQASIRTEAQ